MSESPGPSRAAYYSAIALFVAILAFAVLGLVRSSTLAVPGRGDRSPTPRPSDVRTPTAAAPAPTAEIPPPTPSAPTRPPSVTYLYPPPEETAAAPIPQSTPPIPDPTPQPRR
jgi:hypothetical protein